MNRTLRGIILFAIPVILGIIFYKGSQALNLGKEDPRLAQQDAASFNAAQFVKQTCTTCHGADLHGAYGPDLYKKAKELSESQIEDVLKNGFKGSIGQMPGGLVKGGHEADVAKFIKSLATKQ